MLQKHTEAVGVKNIVVPQFYLKKFVYSKRKLHMQVQ